MSRPITYEIVPGQVFGRLTILGPARRQKGQRARTVKCKCSCGKICIKIFNCIRSGYTKSCGCYLLEFMKTHGHASKGRPTPEYAAWSHMIARTKNPNTKQYEDYGGRGIKVCSRWDKFENFLKDLGRRPSSKHSLDRIDNDKGYSPENCRWATKSEQQQNRRPLKLLKNQILFSRVAYWEFKIPQNVLAKAFGVSVSAISSAVNFHTWKSAR